MKYIIVSWPQSQELMNHPRFKECNLLVEDNFGSAAYAVPEDLYDLIFPNKNVLTTPSDIQEYLNLTNINQQINYVQEYPNASTCLINHLLQFYNERMKELSKSSGWI